LKGNMDVDRQSFIIYKNFYEPIKHLNNTDLGKLFRAIFEYNLSVDGTEKVNGYVVPPEVKIPFEFFKNQFNLDDAKWMKRVKASRENGLKGGRPPQPSEPTGLVGLETEPEKGDTVTVTDTVTDTGTVTETENEKDLKEIQKKSFDVWWSDYRGKSWRGTGGVKSTAAKNYAACLKKYSPEQIQKATDNYLQHCRTSRSFHKDPERFVDPVKKMVEQWLDFTPPPKQSAEPDRSAPIEKSWKNQIDTVRRLLHGKNKQQAQEEWGKIPTAWKDNLKIQQMFAEKN